MDVAGDELAIRGVVEDVINSVSPDSLMAHVIELSQYPGGEPRSRYVQREECLTEAKVYIMDRLREPGGCPWDREQTHQTLKPYLLEESYEALEAIDQEDYRELCGELGDVLLQIVFHAQIASEAASTSSTNRVRSSAV